MFKDIPRATRFGGGREEQWIDRPGADLKSGDKVLPLTGCVINHLWSLYPACEVRSGPEWPRDLGLIAGVTGESGRLLLPLWW